jgi:murein DD-endopeptidase MepM/ murein hydrolase activator NlpD
MTVKGVFAQLGKDLLRVAFPDVYKTATHYRDILKRPSSASAAELAKDPLAKSVIELNRSVIETNEISTNVLEALLVQNALLTKIEKNGIGGGEGNSILDWLTKSRKAKPAAAKPKPKPAARTKPSVTKGKSVRGKNGRYMSAEQAKANPSQVAENPVSKARGRISNAAGKLLRGTPILAGGLEAYDEYTDSGDVAKAATVGAGTTAGAYGGAVGGAALGTLVMPGVGTFLGGLAGGIAGGLLGSKASSTGYDMITTKSVSEQSINATSINYKAELLSLKAEEILINALKVEGLGTEGYSAAKAIPTFRRGIGGKDQQFRKDALANAAVREANRQGGRGGQGGHHKGDGHNHSNDGTGGKGPRGGEVIENKEGTLVPGFGGKIGQGLGAPRPGHLHAGVDVMQDHGSPITASMDGVIVKSEAQGGALNARYGGTSGGIVTVKYANGMTAKYLHTSDQYSKDGPIVKAGQKVKAGDIIGRSGTAAGVPHIHYELFDKHGKRMDPMEYHGWSQGKRILSPEERKAKQEAEAATKVEEKKSEPEAAKPTPESAPPEAVKPPPTPTNSSGQINLDALPKAVRAKYGVMSNFYSDDDIKKEAVKELRKANPNLTISDKGVVTGTKENITKAIDGTKAGLKEKGLSVDVDKFYTPIEPTAPPPIPAALKEPPKPVASTKDRETERLRMERDKLKKQLRKAKKDTKEAKEDKKEGEGNEDEAPPPQDNTRSDRAIWNINPQLHKDEHPQ